MIFLAELAFKSDRLLGWEGDRGILTELAGYSQFLIH